MRKESVRTNNPGADDDIDRALGCFLGLAVGDALGTTLEFTSRDSYDHLTDMVGGGPFKLEPGQWTDDTSMALCLAESLIAHGGLDPHDLMLRFRVWRDQGHNSVTGHCFDIGNATSAAIDRFISSGDPISGDSSPETAGNGSIMRLAPVALFFRNDPDAAARQAAKQSQTTHAAPECLESCALMVRILTALLRGQDWSTAIHRGGTAAKTPRVRALAKGNWQQKTRKEIRSTGYVIDTLEAALWAVDQTTSFRNALLLAVNLGGDADTVGAVAGQFAGARYGLSGIPEGWLSKLAWCQKLQNLALTLAKQLPQPSQLSIPSKGIPVKVSKNSPMSKNTFNSRDSSSREKLLEHLFVGELLRSLWQLNLRGIEVLRAETDSAGYDVVIECQGILRHIQLKTSDLAAKTAVQKINRKLELKPSGCVVWVRFDADTLELKRFLWFGDAPGQPLPALGDKVARHSKGDSKGHKAERPGIRILAKNQFTELSSMAEVARKLFGVG